MAAQQTLETCPEHKLSVAIEHEDKVDRIQRGQWVRAAILGANDGLLSTTSLMMGIGAAKEDRRSMVLSGLAGAIAGACSMAVGEYVSVSTQRDIEQMSNVQKSETELSQLPASHTPNPPGPKPQGGVAAHESPNSAPTPKKSPPGRKSGAFTPGRSPLVRVSLEKAAEVRSDGEETLPSPCKAAVASALAFLCGSFVPLVAAISVADDKTRVVMLAMVTSVALAVFGGVGAHLGGSPVRSSAARVLVGGWIAMAITYGLLKPFDRTEDGE